MCQQLKTNLSKIRKGCNARKQSGDEKQIHVAVIMSPDAKETDTSVMASIFW